MTVDEQSRLSPKKELFQPSGGNNRFNLLLLAFFYGAYFFLGAILTYMAGGISEHDEFSIFVQGWITVPPLTFLAVIGLYKLKQKNFQSSTVFFPILLGINTIFGLLAASGLYLVKLNNSVPMLTQAMTGVLVLFPLVQIIALWSLHRFRNSPALSNPVAFENRVYWLIPVGIGAIMALFSGIFASYYQGYTLPLQSLLLAAPFGFLAYLHQYLIRPSAKKVLIALDVLAILLIIGACFDPYFTINTVHENFFIGPINALLHGKTMLVDVYSQYGVFVHEFLALFFKLKLLPLNYQGLALLVALFSMAQYVLVYFLARTLIKSAKFSLVILCVVLLMNLFATVGNFQSFPSIGPVRFGLCYILITLIALRLKYPARKSIFLWLEYGILGIASIWSFETFIYTATIFYGIRGYEIIAKTNTFSGFFKKVSLELLKSILVIALFHSIQALTIFLGTGAWPHWAYYFEYIYVYSVAGFGGLPIDAWSPWFIIIAVYFIALIYPFITWILTKEWDTSLETQTILCFAFFGVAQFTYYVGRSAPEALFHVCVPAILIAGYGASQITKPGNIQYKSVRYATIFVVYATIALLGIAYTPSLIKKIPDTGFGFVYSILEGQLAYNSSGGTIFLESYNQLWHPKPNSPQAAGAIKLIKKYAPYKTRVMIFLPNKNLSQATTEALFLSNKAHLYPVTDQLQDSLSSQVSNFIVNYSPNLKTGDVVFLPTDPEALLLRPSLPVGFQVGFQFIEYQKMIVLKLCNQFRFSAIESTPSGITAFRLKALGNGISDDYCEKVRAMKNQ